MYFKSRITWIETVGTFQTSELDIGNQFIGRARSWSKLTRIEDATLRIWVADIVSVAFGKDGKRFIMALALADGVAKGMATRLINFSNKQGTIVAPTLERDVQRAKILSRMDNPPGGDLSAMVKVYGGRRLLVWRAGEVRTAQLLKIGPSYLETYSLC
jgi:hypothetical protein